MYARLAAKGAAFLALPTVPPWGPEVPSCAIPIHLIELSQVDA
jgi:hypothetical protein